MRYLRFPVRCPCAADVDLHFWDATDELLGCQMDLLFERDRVYLHKAHGHFGAVPLSVSGAASVQSMCVIELCMCGSEMWLFHRLGGRPRVGLGGKA